MTESITRDRIGEMVHLAFQIINENDGQMASRDVTVEVAKRMTFTEYEKGLNNSGHVRWENLLHWYTVDTVKAGWLRKKNGVWYLTPEGEEALKLEPSDFMAKANAAYKMWKKERDSDVGAPEGESDNQTAEATLEQARGLARKEIQHFVLDADPYDFQDLVAALLRGMGYHTPFVAPRGRDGGVDVRAYQDPLGTREPRIKVQVKHRQDKANAQEIRQLAGLLREGEIGLFVSTGGFTSDAISSMRNATKHIEKIDLDQFIDMWQEYYDRLDEEDKALLPLRSIMFLAPDE